MLTKSELEKVRISLFAGKYNLLLGAGISLDSIDHDDITLPSGWELQKQLCNLKGVSTDRPLTKVYSLLTDDERTNLLTNRFSKTKPGKTVKEIPNFLWRQIFTFNIDDALEGAYEDCNSPKQTASAINFNAPYVTNSSPNELAIVHLHGFARDPAAGYVFALTEYAKISQSINPWMNVLSQILATEPFIIAGTSLTEPDLEYYLSTRTTTSSRIDRGPSILIEPNPDAVTINDCERHGLILVKSTLSEFLQWLQNELGEPPSLGTLILPSTENLFSAGLDPIKKISFFSSFELLQPAVPTENDGSFSGFYFGQQPAWRDLASDLDIATEDEFRIAKKAKFFLSGGAFPHRVIVAIGESGTGKSTNIRRVAYDLAVDSNTVLFLKSNADVDYDDTLDCIRAIIGRVVIFIDGVAEHVGLARLLLEKPDLEDKILLICAERDYRKTHIEGNLETFTVEYIPLNGWTKLNYLQLIDRFRNNGLLASADALKNPSRAADELIHEPISIATCRLLNNFRPFDQIMRSVWSDADEPSKMSYLTAALAEYCVPVGVKYSILNAAQANPQLSHQLSNAHPLPLASHEDNDDYILPLNATVGDRILTFASKERKDLLLDVFVNLANEVAPYVNRRAVIKRTAEARLSGRLFQAEEVVVKFLGADAEKFYTRVKKQWDWNSRYWEHRALEMANRNLAAALQYGRHAVAREAHPFPWTTLASLLMRTMVESERRREENYNEAFALLVKALDFEATKLRRHRAHAYLVLFRGTEKYIKLGGVLSAVSKGEIASRVADAGTLLKANAQVVNSIDQLRMVL